MENDEFLAHSAKIAAAEAATQQPMTPTAKADLLETVMLGELEVKIAKSWICNVAPRNQRIGPAQGRHLMGDDPRLPQMPPAPDLVDFFKYRVCRNLNGSSHLLQSANLAREKDLPEKIILACLLHDISVAALIRVDHGYWAAQLVAPYVDDEIAWAIQHHQALRYFAAPDYGYDYPKFYKEVFGEDYVPEPYIKQAAEQARSHRWYDSAMQVVVNDLYAFDPNKQVDIEEFTDIIGRNFRQPKQGLGFDNSPSAHMWRTMIWPNNFL